MSRSFARAVPPIAVLLVASAVRLSSWSDVFGEDHLRPVGDSDPHYHLLRAERWLRGEPGAPWRDPALNWPRGADVPWPPLYDALLAGVARITQGPMLEREAMVSGTAALPVALGLALVALVAALGRTILGKGRGWIAALMIAALPATSEFSLLGRVDQHALEFVLYASILLTFVAASRRPARWLPHAAALAGLLTASFWTWMGSPLFLFVPLLAAATWHVSPPEEGPTAAAALRVLAAGCLSAAALVALSTALFGPDGALSRGSTTGVGGLQVSLLAASGLFASILLVLRRRPRAPGTPLARAREVLAAVAVPGAALLAAAPLRSGIGGGLTALSAGNPWYASIEEFQPLLNVGWAPLADELLHAARGFGLVHVAAALGVVPLVHAWRTEPGRRPQLLVLAYAALLLVPTALLRKRFGAYAMIPLAIAAEEGLRHLSGRIGTLAKAGSGRRIQGASLAALCLVTVAPSFPEHLASAAALLPEEETTVRWLGSMPTEDGREAVLAPWTYGHAIQYFADRPVLVSPFGTEGGEGSMQDFAAFWFAGDEAAAEAILERRRCGAVLLTGLITESIQMFGFAPAGRPLPIDEQHDVLHGRRLIANPAFWRMIPSRLYYRDGAESQDAPALTGFRLVFESPLSVPAAPWLGRQLKVFEPVAGARVAVAGPPGTPLRASVHVLTNIGREFDWSLDAEFGDDGVATLRLPYASGDNQAVHCGPWAISAGARTFKLVLHEADVRHGRHGALDLSAAEFRWSDP